jgi:hypothetical protein
MLSGEAVVNNSSNDYDFRAESDGNGHMLFVEASTNRVGIGQSSPATTLDIGGAVNSDMLTMTSVAGRGLKLGTAVRGSQNDGVGVIDAQDTDSTGGRLELHTAGVQRFRIESTDAVFNSGSNDQDFRIESDNNAYLFYLDAGKDQIFIGDIDGVASGTPADAPIEVVAGASENCINTQVATAGFTSFVSTGPTTSGGNVYNFGAMINASGSVVGTIVVNHGSTTYNTSSDYRLKENVTGLTDATARIKQLQPKRFNFIEVPDVTVDGFLAHEVETVVPEAITGEKDAVDADGNPIYQGIDHSKLVPLLVATIKELEARIAALESE